MLVTTHTLEMRTRPEYAARDLPQGVRIERADGMTPEFARFLYALVGGEWFWTDRLTWTRDEWAEELAVPGTEFLVAYGEGVPLGYVHVQAIPHEGRSQAEIRYFGIVERAFGRGLGASLLEHGVDAAWSLSERRDVPEVDRVWVHTCNLDGPAALSNYVARGFVECGRSSSVDEERPARPLGAWSSTTGQMR